MMFFKIVAAATMIFLFTGCEEKEVIEKKSAKVVKLYDLNDSKDAKRVANYPAVIHSLQESNMAFEVSGKIIKFFYQEGEFIKKGSVVAQLDNTLYKADYNAALANYNQAKLDYDRYEKLYKARSIAKRDFELKKQALDVSRSEYNIAKKKLDDTKLIAEFDGIMAKKFVKDFERITEKQAIISLQDNSAYKVKFFAPENDILEVEGKISKETATKMVDFTVMVGKKKNKIPASFMDISTTAEQISRTFEVTLKIQSQPNINILPGMTANVEVADKKIQVNNVFIPLGAVFSDATKKSYIWLVDEQNKVHKQEVNVGRLEKSRVEIVGLNTRYSKIVISGVRFLNENDQIQVYKKIGN
jgi:RND family efflux transporter MFP subunit